MTWHIIVDRDQLSTLKKGQPDPSWSKQLHSVYIAAFVMTVWGRVYVLYYIKVHYVSFSHNITWVLWYAVGAYHPSKRNLTNTNQFLIYIIIFIYFYYIDRHCLWGVTGRLQIHVNESFNYHRRRWFCRCYRIL